MKALIRQGSHKKIELKMLDPHPMSGEYRGVGVISSLQSYLENVCGHYARVLYIGM